jgi:hypothetical protein
MVEEDKKSESNLYGYLLAASAVIVFLVLVYLIFFRSQSDILDFFGDLFTFNLLSE